MNISFSWFTGLFGGRALADSSGKQSSVPATSMVDGTQSVTIDNALQISAVWACASVIANTIGTLPLLVYENGANGMRSVARESSLWALLHTSPNARMTSAEFWTSIVLNLAMRNNAYARIERNPNGEAYALWPMAADQVEVQVIAGEPVYLYRIDNDVMALAAENVLHIKGMGNGTLGLSRLDYMRATTSEAANSTAAANKLFSSSGKPTGVLMVDNVLSTAQRDAIRANFAEMQAGSSSRLFVLEANMKYQQLSLSPEDMQLLETRQFGVEEVARWFGVPPVMIGHSNVTTWGSGVEQIVEGFYKFTVRPVLVSIEQAVAKRVLTAGQRARYTVEFNFEGLLRVNMKDRFEVYAKAVQNGLKTRNECRQLENDPPIIGGDLITVQSNLTEVQNLPNPNQGA